MTTTEVNSQTRTTTKRLVPVANTIVILAVPLLLTIGSVRLVMSNLFLQLEYNRPGFPADMYGFTREDRLAYAPFAIAYLLDPSKDITYLSDLRLPRDNVPVRTCIVDPEDPSLCLMYNERELRHMVDVKVLTQYTYLLGIVTAVLTGIAVPYLWRTSRADLHFALFRGSILTLTIIGTIIVVALFAWDAFFTGFHTLFFEGDSWLFYYSDTLIRLFPEQFWFDAALLIGSLTSLGTVVLLWFSQRQLRSREQE